MQVYGEHIPVDVLRQILTMTSRGLRPRLVINYLCRRHEAGRISARPSGTPLKTHERVFAENAVELAKRWLADS